MTPRSLVFAVSLLLVSLSADAQSDRPVRGTAGPMSPAWGPDLEQVLQKTFDRLLTASGYDNGPGRQKEMRGPTQLLYRKEFRDAEGTPAAALSARTGPNPSDHSLVFAGYGVFEICRDQDELAFIMGHEIAHLVLKHPEQNQAKRLLLLAEWSTKHDIGKFPNDDAAIRAFERDNAVAMAAFIRDQERDADREGIALSRLAGFNPKGGAKAMQHGQDWVWATTDGTPDTTHDPLPRRVSELRRLALQMEAQDRRYARTDGASGSLRSSAQGAVSSAERYDGNIRAGKRSIMLAEGARPDGGSPLLGGGQGAGQLAPAAAGADATQKGYLRQADDRPVPAPNPPDPGAAPENPLTRPGLLGLGAAALAAAAAAFSNRR